jgi:drug/metabolite transporter (DMT)-like permease
MHKSVKMQFILAFAAIYLVWGSTYLAIRVVVATVPPLLAAGIRFSIAGGVLYLWSRLRGTPAPDGSEWRGLWTLGLLMFVGAYATLFSAQKSVPSGVASVLVATIPVWTLLLEMAILKLRRPNRSMIAAIFFGIIGVVFLVWGGDAAGRVPLLPALVILVGEVSWSLGSVLSKRLPLPTSKVMSAGGQMLTGGIVLLILSVVFGEWRPWPRIEPRAALAIGYLIVAGSLVAFTAYTWLLGRVQVTRVASYAYVNPVIALAIGYWFGGEKITARIIGGAFLVIVSVLLIIRPAGEPAGKEELEQTAGASRSK